MQGRRVAARRFKRKSEAASAEDTRGDCVRAGPRRLRVLGQAGERARERASHLLEVMRFADERIFGRFNFGGNYAWTVSRPFAQVNKVIEYGYM